MVIVLGMTPRRSTVSVGDRARLRLIAQLEREGYPTVQELERERYRNQRRKRGDKK